MFGIRKKFVGWLFKGEKPTVIQKPVTVEKHYHEHIHYSDGTTTTRQSGANVSTSPLMDFYKDKDSE